MDYFFVARGKDGHGFNNEPSTCHFLAVPESDDQMLFKHKITKSKWTNAVLDAARNGTSNPQTDGDILFFVHGYNNSQSMVLERHRKIRSGLEALGFDGVVVSFDWPSADSALNYLEDRMDAKLSAFRLVQDGIATFSALQSPKCKINLHVLAHSMGCYVVREAFDDADDRASIASNAWAVSQVMLVAADVSVDSLNAGHPRSSSLYRHCVRLTNYFNPMDDVLSISAVKRIGVAPRAGRNGMGQPRHEKSANVDCGPYFKNSGWDKGLTWGHKWYFDDANFLQDVFYTISGQIDRAAFPTRKLAENQNLQLVAPS
jgi:esterase/lipase superfamily enzyme